MAPKSVLVIAGITGLAAVTGVTSAVIQSQTPAPTTISASPRATTRSVPLSPAPSLPSTPTSPTIKQSSEPEVPATSTQGEASRKVESCKVTMAKVADPNPPLNVRSTPNTTSDDNIVGQLKNGTFVTVRGEQEGWFQISTPVKGWISMANTDQGCNEKVEQVSLGAGENSTTITDRFVGAGSHQYRLNLAQDQTLTVTSNRGPLPAIVTPDGKLLSEPQGENKAWTGKLSSTGDYALVLESNYKGYKYSFSVQVK